MSGDQWVLSERLRPCIPEGVFHVLCFFPRRWMLFQPFRWMLFKKVIQKLTERDIQRTGELNEKHDWEPRQ